MGWIYCLIPKLATKTVCPRFSIVPAPYSVLSLMAAAPARSALREVRIGMEMSTMPAPVQPYFIRNCSSITYHSLAPCICSVVM